MLCRRPHDQPPELQGLPARAELHALGMPREWRGEIDDLLLESRHLPGLRLLRIYVPAPALRGDLPLPVMLVNDGHKAFEPANHERVAPWQQSGTLQLHRVMDGLLCVGAIRPAVVVAIGTHASSRANQYVPVRTRFGVAEFGGDGDTYLDLLEHEVLPAVQRQLGTIALSTAASDRVLCGMSIGGISALYGALVRPDVFGGAIALSPSAWVDDGFLLRIVQERGIASPRIAADIGASERPVIRDHCQRLFAALRTASGGRALAVEVDGQHNEDSWRARLPPLLRHVLPAD